MEKECVINPKTGRAVVVKGKIGRQVLKNQAAQPVKAKTAPKPKPKEPNTMYKKPIGPVKPKKVNTMYKKPIGPVKPKKVNTMYDKPIGPVKPKPKPEPKKVEAKPKNDIDDLVYYFDTVDFPLLMYQKARLDKNEKIIAMIKKIENLGKKKRAVIPSDLFSFYPDFLNALIDEYGASEKTIKMINDNMIYFILYENEDAIVPDELDMKYFLKYMNQRNKNKFSFLFK